MDINSVCLSGILQDIGVNASKSSEYPVVEARLLVNNGTKKKEKLISSINIRSYGKKSMFFVSLKEGDFIVIEGHLVEDKCVNSHTNKMQVRHYVDIEKVKSLTLEGEN